MQKQLNRYFISGQHHDRDCLVTRMFNRTHDWVKTRDIYDANLVVFTNGPRVWPGWYDGEVGGEAIASMRELLDAKSFHIALNHVIPMLGYGPRGAHFINAMNGGYSYELTSQQRIVHDKHGSHDIVDGYSGFRYLVSSNHRMGLGLPKEVDESVSILAVDQKDHNVIESLAYMNTFSLCWQPNVEPLMEQMKPAQDLLFTYIEELLERA